LAQTFQDRERNGVYKEGTTEVEKTVFVKAPRSVKYGDVVKVFDAIKGSGAQPIGLQIDDLPQ
jgi:biopolymer transport protein ExbD